MSVPVRKTSSEQWEEYAHTAPYLDGTLRWYRFGQDPQVVLIHGLASRSRAWDQVPFLLSEQGIDSLAVDLPGHGGSVSVSGQKTPALMAQAVHWLASREGIRQAHLVGHSLGGGVSMSFLDQYPLCVASVTLNASGGLGRGIHPGLRLVSAVPASEPVLKTVVNARTLGALRAVRGLARRVGMPDSHMWADSTMEVLTALTDEQGRKAFNSVVGSVCDTHGQTLNGVAALESFDQSRVTLITCEKDPVLDAKDTIRAARVVPGAKLVVLPGKSHEPHVNYPQVVADLIAEQVAGVKKHDTVPSLT